jgi:hypothetical protein
VPTMIRPATWPTAERIRPVLAALVTAFEALERLNVEMSPLVDRSDRFEPLEDAPTPTLEEVGVLSALITETTEELDAMRRQLESFRELHESAVAFALPVVISWLPEDDDDGEA